MIDLYYLSLLSNLNIFANCCLGLTIAIIIWFAFHSFIEDGIDYKKYYSSILIAFMLSLFFTIVLPSQQIIDIEIKKIEGMKK